MTTGKTKALTRRTFAGKVISLLFNMLSRLAIDFFPKEQGGFCLFVFVYLFVLISWLQSPSAVILEPPKKEKQSHPLFPLFTNLFAI